jgi:hypothetical protein
MKNIYNLISDAFAAANLDEQQYTTKIELTYKITIHHKEDPNGGRLFIFMGVFNNCLFDVECVNLLLNHTELDLFMTVIENQIVIITPPLHSTEANLNNIEFLE